MAASELLSALAEIKQHQQLNQLTGAVHTAAWVVPGQGVQTVREDVGRHNALDKLIGLLIRIGKNPATGYVIVTSRASYELIQKAASVSITLLAAMSAPTGLAIRLAEEAGLTLVGFVRDNQHVVYTHAEHLNHTIYPTLIKKSNLMHIEKLISMANDIADFFNAESDKEIAAEGVKKHILRSWDPPHEKGNYQALSSKWRRIESFGNTGYEKTLGNESTKSLEPAKKRQSKLHGINFNGSQRDKLEAVNWVNDGTHFITL